MEPYHAYRELTVNWNEIKTGLKRNESQYEIYHCVMLENNKNNITQNKHVAKKTVKLKWEIIWAWNTETIKSG